jgi:hypothetical protein
MPENDKICGRCRHWAQYIPDDKSRYTITEGICLLTYEDTRTDHTCAFFEERGLYHAFKTEEERKRELTKH